MIQIVEIANPFEPNKKKITEMVYTGKDITVYAETENRDVYLNGHKADNPEQIVPLDGSQIIILPHIAGKGLRSVLGIVAMIGLSVFAGNIAIGKALGFAHLSAASMLASGAVMFLGGKIINAVFPQQTANLNYDEQQQSQSYGWDLPTPSTAAGGIVGETYGECIPSAQLLEQHVETVGDEQYLNLLYCGGYGPVDSIEDIRIEYTDISNFSGVQLETRLGTNDQKPISFFKNTPLDQSVGVQLKEGESVTRTSDSTKATGLEVTLEFPGGLFHVNNKGNYENCTAKFKLEYRKGKNDNWHNFDKNNSGRTFDVTASTNSEVRRTFSVSGLEAGQYDVRVTATSRPHSSRDQSLVNWSILTSFLDGVYSRPNKVLVAMRIKASSQLSSGVPSVNWRQTRKYVWVHNPDTNQYEQKAADNPIWACYDILHGARRLKNINTGAYEYAVFGYPAESLDAYFDQWKEAADYADEKIVNQDGEKEPRYRFDAYFDTNQKRWNAAQKAANVGHAAIIPHGRNIGIVVDKPGQITQIFGEGRTTMSSFKGSFSAKEDRAKAIEVTYNDGQNDFKNTVMTIRSPNYNTDQSSDNTAQLSLFGVKRRSQAYREAVTALATNERQLQFIELSADIDAIVAEYGDIVGVNHTVGRIGIASGRVVAINGNEVTIDKEVELDASKKYEIIFMLKSDALIKREVAASNGKTNILNITTPFDDQQAPEKYDNYAFGEAQKAVKPFRIVNATRNGDLQVTLKLTEYDEAMYATELDYARYPVIDYSSKPNIAQIMSVTVSEQSYTVGHTTMADIDINWQLGDSGIAPDNYIVDVQSRNSDYHERFSTRFTSQKARNVRQGETYDITVYCIFDSVPVSHTSTSVFVQGTNYEKNNATGLMIILNGKGFDLSWTAATGTTITGYNVYQGKYGTAMADCTCISEKQSGTTCYASVSEGGQYQFYVESVDADGNPFGNVLSGIGYVTVPGKVTNAKAYSIYRQYQDGSTGYDIVVTFTLPSTPSVVDAEVYYKTNHIDMTKISGALPVGVSADELGYYADWRYAGKNASRVVISAAQLGDTYRIKLIAEDSNGFTAPDEDAVYLELKIEAKQTVPSTPTGFKKSFVLNKGFTFSWNDVTDSDVDFYELRYDENCGAVTNLIARVQGTSVTLERLNKREATVYLYAHNATKKYGYPAKLTYSYPQLDAPKSITIEKAILAVNITIPPMIDGAEGTKLYIDGAEYDIGTGTQYCYANKAGIYSIQACYYDVFGDGCLTAVYYATIDPYIDPKYIEDSSLSREKMDKTINTAVDNAGKAIERLNDVDKDIVELKQTDESITSTVAQNKKAQEDADEQLASQIKQTADTITSTVEKNKTDTDVEISQIKQNAETISSTIQANKTATDSSISDLSSQITQNANSITSVITNLNDSTKAKENYSAIAQMQDGIESKVAKDGIISTINQSAEGLTIDGKYVHVTGDTLFENNVITNGALQAGSVTADKLSANTIALTDNQGIKGGQVTLDANGMTVVNSNDGSSVLFGENGMQFVNKNGVKYSMVGASITGTANDGQYVRFIDGAGNAAPWQNTPTIITMLREVQTNHPNYSTSNIFLHCYADEITASGFRVHAYSGISNGTGSRNQYQECGYMLWDGNNHEGPGSDGGAFVAWRSISFTVNMPSNASRVQFIGHFSVNTHYGHGPFVSLHGKNHTAAESQNIIITCNGDQTYNGILIEDSQGYSDSNGNKCNLNNDDGNWVSTSVTSKIMTVTGGCNLNCTLNIRPWCNHPGDNKTRDSLEIKFYIDSIRFWVDGEQKLASGNAAFLVLDAKNSGYYKTES